MCCPVAEHWANVAEALRRLYPARALPPTPAYEARVVPLKVSVARTEELGVRFKSVRVSVCVCVCVRVCVCVCVCVCV